MRKVIITVLAVALCVACVVCCFACANKSDSKKIEEKGYFVCGITLYDPMNYANEDGDLVGFETEFAKAVAEKLGLDVKFQIIDWGQKYNELNGGSIDCIWNGFTANSKDDDGVARTDKVDISYYYMNNEQCVVTKKANVDNFPNIASLEGKKAGVETGSAGAAFAESAKANITVNKPSQQATLIDLKSGAVEFVVMDKTLAKSVVGKGDYSELAIVDAIQTESEKYAVGFRKGSDFKDKVNAAMIEVVKDGKLKAIAEKYNVANVLDTEFAEK